ncbi:hypothetical protein SAMN02910447_03513 [Ruminococcus sp. YE71]|uniref:MarR family transcriptional regulator n=1 Tax=unclassified Ruminococcus TaxID=2608920 RepID=UPI00088863C2|nr:MULTISPECIES: helix-turn-helix domain-containing protein [unclassified Ruminococcus]SDA32332.1 hypothetical protein SAMN02910446_03579 [Ruminococcus sp. YE78]SFW53209.1 hypothetical protein SAMN02910447_03513 [Ruminococcus sp. YE71]
MILPNMNTASDIQPYETAGSNITPQMRLILDHIEKHGQITEDEIQSLLEVKHTRAFSIAKQMRDIGLIQVSGRGKDKRYIKE